MFPGNKLTFLPSPEIQVKPSVLYSTVEGIYNSRNELQWAKHLIPIDVNVDESWIYCNRE